MNAKIMSVEAQSAVARHWIDGGWHESGHLEESHSPSTGKPLGKFAAGGRPRQKQPLLPPARHSTPPHGRKTASFALARSRNWPHVLKNAATRSC